MEVDEGEDTTSKGIAISVKSGKVLIFSFYLNKVVRLIHIRLLRPAVSKKCPMRPANIIFF